MVGIFDHIISESNFGLSEVVNCRLVFCCFLGEVGKGLLDDDQVFGFLSGLSRLFDGALGGYI